jgi:hypothetical protein
MTDDGLDDEARERRGQPEQRQFAFVRPKVFVDGRHVAHLQAPAELDAEEPKTHVPDLPKAQARFLHKGCAVTATVFARARKANQPHHPTASLCGKQGQQLPQLSQSGGDQTKQRNTAL